MIIYKVTNKVNNKVYVGQTIRTLKQRMNEHRSDASLDKYGMPIHRAIKKYGWDNFVWEVVYKGSDIDDLNQKEIDLITEYQCLTPNGYNVCEGGKSGGKRVFTEEHIENLRKGQQSRDKSTWKPHTEETKKKMSVVKKGIKREPFSDEWRVNMSKSMSGEKNPMYNRNHTEETKQKMSGSNSSLSERYIITTPEGEEIEIKGLRAFCRDNGLNRQLMSAVSRGLQTHHKGYKCRKK